MAFLAAREYAILDKEAIPDDLVGKVGRFDIVLLHDVHLLSATMRSQAGKLFESTPTSATVGV